MTSLFDFNFGEEKTIASTTQNKETPTTQNKETPKVNISYHNTRYTTPRQLGFYYDLCNQKDVDIVDGVEQMTFDEVSKLINQLRNYYPVSDKQQQTISQLVVELNEMGFQIKEPDYNSLTGGREGSASNLIEQLIKMIADNQDKAKPRPEQLLQLADMYLCPDVAFEDYEVERRINLTDELWRRYTPEEFTQQLAEKLNRQQATEILEKFRNVYLDWKKDRINDKQIEYIRVLEARMANISTPKEVIWTVDLEGNLIPAPNGKSETSPQAYTSLDEMELRMFNQEEAKKYIDLLKYELANKSNTMFGERADGSATFEPIRKPTSAKEVRLKDYEELQNLMFKLESVAGFNDPELHEAVSYMLVEELDAEMLNKNKEKIHATMRDLIEHDCITFEGLVELVQDSPTAQKILVGL